MDTQKMEKHVNVTPKKVTIHKGRAREKEGQRGTRQTPMKHLTKWQ